jgi:hypothetical protein
MIGLTEREWGERARVRLARLVASYAMGVTEADLLDAGQRNAAVTLARQVAMYLSHVGLGMSLGRAALAMGCDRSTISTACQKVEDRREEHGFDAWLGALEETVRAAPQPAPPGGLA